MALGELQASPTDTFHKMKKLLHIKPSVTKDVLLCITGSNLTVKDGMTKVSTVQSIGFAELSIAV